MAKISSVKSSRWLTKSILLALLALLAGAVAGLGYAPARFRLATLIGFAVLIWIATRVRSKTALLFGVFFGLGLYGVSVHWMYPVAIWLGILVPAVMSLYAGLGAWGWSMIGKLGRLKPASGLAKIFCALQPVFLASWWILVEWVCCRFPVGGFGWIRLGFASLDTPYDSYLSLFGVTGTGFLMALTAGLVAQMLSTVFPLASSVEAGAASRSLDIRCRAAELSRLKNYRFLSSLLGVLLIFAVGLAIAPVAKVSQSKANLESAKKITVGVVQGDVGGKSGVDAIGYALEVTQNHYSETILLAAMKETGMIPDFDFVLWPENATDLDPTVDPTTKKLVDLSEQIANSPILVGAVMDGPGENQRQTSALFWRNGKPTARYDKRNLVPFGEYTPFKDLIEPIFPIVSQVGKQSVAGSKPGVIAVELGKGETAGQGAQQQNNWINLGVVICFELAWDSTVYDTVTNGAEITVVQSNNATYTYTAQPQQQFDITRVRAMELQRPIVVATTSSFSGMIDADGVVIDRSEQATSYANSYRVAASNKISLAVRIAPWLEKIFAAIGLLSLVLTQILHRNITPSTIEQS